MAFFCVFWPGGARGQFATPEAAIQAIYALYHGTGGPGFPSDQAAIKRFLEPALARAWIKDSAGASEGKSFLGADPFIQGQDWNISGLEIKPIKVTGHRATVQASFRNFNQPTRVTYRLKRSSDGWRIHDLVGRGTKGLRRELSLRD